MHLPSPKRFRRTTRQHCSTARRGLISGQQFRHPFIGANISLPQELSRLILERQRQVRSTSVPISASNPIDERDLAALQLDRLDQVSRSGVRAAFLRLVREVHPDKAGDGQAVERFRLLRGAYERAMEALS